jgi:hypothetical protein
LTCGSGALGLACSAPLLGSDEDADAGSPCAGATVAGASETAGAPWTVLRVAGDPAGTMAALDEAVSGDSLCAAAGIAAVGEDSCAGAATACCAPAVISNRLAASRARTIVPRAGLGRTCMRESSTTGGSRRVGRLTTVFTMSHPTQSRTAGAVQSSFTCITGLMSEQRLQIVSEQFLRYCSFP